MPQTNQPCAANDGEDLASLRLRHREISQELKAEATRPRTPFNSPDRSTQLRKVHDLKRQLRELENAMAAYDGLNLRTGTAG